MHAYAHVNTGQQKSFNFSSTRLRKFSKRLIFRKLVKRDFTIVPNELTTDHTISSSAYRLLRFCTSQKPDYRFNFTVTQKRMKRSRSQIYRLLSQLISGGYCKRVQHQPERGRYSGSDLLFSDSPIFLDESWSETPTATKASEDSTCRINDTATNTKNILNNIRPKVILTRSTKFESRQKVLKEPGGSRKPGCTMYVTLFERIKQLRQEKIMDNFPQSELKSFLLIKLSFMQSSGKLKPTDNPENIAQRMVSHCLEWKSKGYASLQAAVDRCFELLEERYRKDRPDTPSQLKSLPEGKISKDFNNRNRLDSIKTIGSLLATKKLPEVRKVTNERDVLDERSQELLRLRNLAERGMLCMEMIPEDLPKKELEFLRYLSLSKGGKILSTLQDKSCAEEPWD